MEKRLTAGAFGSALVVILKIRSTVRMVAKWAGISPTQVDRLTRGTATKRAGGADEPVTRSGLRMVTRLRAYAV
jgi:hypothetical protein